MSHPALGLHRDEILACASVHGATNVRLFGSLARGEGKQGSDVDLLVSFERGRSLLDLIAFKHDVEDLIDLPVDVVSDRALSPYIRDRVIAEALPL